MWEVDHIKRLPLRTPLAVCYQWIDAARHKLQAWKVEYNETRLHWALSNLKPAEYMGQVHLAGRP